MLMNLYNKLVSRRRISESGCWEWTGATNSKGYGNTYWQGKYITAHRAMWLAVHETLPANQVLHKCDNPPCFNPDCLFEGTQKDNVRDMIKKGRQSQGPEHNKKIRDGWTPELRNYRAKQTSERMRAERESRAIAAGMPTDWKYCPMCHAWKPRTDYQLNAARHDGIKPICRPCATVQMATLRRKRKLKLTRIG